MESIFNFSYKEKNSFVRLDKEFNEYIFNPFFFFKYKEILSKGIGKNNLLLKRTDSSSRKYFFYYEILLKSRLVT